MTDLETHLSKLTGYLARFREGGIQNRIAGADRPGSGGTFDSISPVDESVICAVARSTGADVDAAAEAAAAAFPAWRDMPALERKAILIRIAEAIEARAEEIALCECWDTGQAHRFMSKAALRGAENFRFFADRAPAARDGQMLPSPTLMSRGELGWTRHTFKPGDHVEFDAHPSRTGAPVAVGGCTDGCRVLVNGEPPKKEY